jgi:hypothetical protein
MFRGFLLFAAFAFVSPGLRGYLAESYGAFDQLITHNTTVAYTGAGLLGFCSFLAIKLTARKQ